MDQLLLVLRDPVHRYCLYRVAPPVNDEDELVIRKLEEPLLKMDESSYPEGMSFVAVGSSIFIVGGYYPRDGNNPLRVSDKTFIYDTLSDNLVSGPTLVSGKSYPYLLTVGAKVFALSCFLDKDELIDGGMDPKPQFEVLDTKDPKGKWSALPVPSLRVSRRRDTCLVEACVVAYGCGGTSPVIFISVKDGGTYCFDLNKHEWNYVSEKMLPFIGYAMSMPQSSNLPSSPSLCYAISSKSKRYTAFCFRYHASEGDENIHSFDVDEIGIGIPPDLSPPLPPRTFYVRPVTVFGPLGRVYIIESGVDNIEGHNTGIGNNYVKVCALEVLKVQDEMVNSVFKKGQLLSGGQTLKSCKKKKRRKMKHDDELQYEMVKPDFKKVQLFSGGQTLTSCKKKKRRQMKHDDEEHAETVNVELNNRHVLKRCKKNKRKGEMETANEEEKDETIELNMTRIWRRSFYGGPICGMEHVTAAFAM